MEFPMMANIGSFDSFFMTNLLISHEIAHSYFPMYVGVDEKKYAWMDEGFASLLSDDYLKNKNMDYYTGMASNVYENFAVLNGIVH